jgi:large subunit ribosomal protein L25
MEEIVLKASHRTVVGKQVNALRRAGLLPAVIYGRHIQAIPITLDQRSASRTLHGLSASTLIIIEVDGEQHYALVREKQRTPILGTLRHIDFQAVSLTETVRSQVTIRLLGEAPAVKNQIGILVANLEEVEIEALPRALPDRLEISISGLKAVGDAIYVRDLPLPEGVEVLADPEEVVVVITAPETEGEAEELVIGAEPELVERGKREEEVEE